MRGSEITGRLNQQLEAFRAGFLARLPAGERRDVLAAAERLRAEGDHSPVPGVEDRAPEFTLPDSHGRLVSLRGRLAHGPVVLLFVRGGWCPFCSLTLRSYQEALPEIRSLGADILAVTPQPARGCSMVTERDLLAFRMLSDQGNQVAQAYGVAYELPAPLRAIYGRMGHDLPRLNGTGNWRVPLPATFVIGPDFRVALASVEPVAHRRLEPAHAVQALEALRTAV